MNLYIRTRLVIRTETMNIKPLSDHILIEPMKVEEKTKSGILLPDTAEKERPEQGKIIAVGPGKVTSSGKNLPMDVKMGDTVLFTKYGPTEIKVEDKEYLIAKQEDILAIIE
jgi:chaperonin GroES